MSIEFYRQRYLDACHQMQTGVKVDQETGSDDGTPKHLRVGINVALCDHAALITLLIEKGVFTQEEYLKKLCETMEQEVERYKKILNTKFGREIDLI